MKLRRKLNVNKNLSYSCRLFLLLRIFLVVALSPQMNWKIAEKIILVLVRSGSDPLTNFCVNQPDDPIR